MNNFKFYNYFFNKVWNSTFIYFTYWGLIVQFLFYIGVLKKYQESVLLIVLSVSFIGAILTYIYPKRMSTKTLNLKIEGTKLQMFDLVFHQVPLFIFLVQYDHSIKSDNLVLAVSLLLFYTIVYNPLKVYDYNCSKKRAKEQIGMNNVINNNKFRYHLGAFMIVLYFITLMIAISNNIFA